MITYQTIARDGAARTGEMQTSHGPVSTPAFMPVATHGAIKGLEWSSVRSAGTELLLSNTYHLYLRPGREVIAQAGGLHRFIGWDGPILTDSGGFQIFSLGHKRGGKLARIDEEGVTFYSHYDGSAHRLTPQLVWELQRGYGVDIAMPLDECPPSTSSLAVISRAVGRTHRWLAEQAALWRTNPEGPTALFGIVQGGLSYDLRERSLQVVTGENLPGYALGGLAVGEGKESLYDIVRRFAGALPADRPRYLMGVGEPLDLLWAVGWGIDMFDCVLPTRLARHGAVWVIEGPSDLVEAFWAGETERLLAESSATIDIVRHNFPHQSWRTDASPVQPGGPTMTAELRRDYAHHLAKEQEYALYSRFSQHNLLLLQTLLRHASTAIIASRYNDLLQRFGLTLAET